MTLSKRLLQAGTIALFSTMIAGLVVFKTSALNTVWPQASRDSLQPPWMDSVQMRNLLLEMSRRRKNDYFMTSSKVGPIVRKTDASQVPKPGAEFSGFDSLLAMEVLRMRYETRQFSPTEALRFEEKLNQARSGPRYGRHIYFDLPTQDSIKAWDFLKYPPEMVVNLSDADKERFEQILSDTHSGYVLGADTVEALKSLAAEKARR